MTAQPSTELERLKAMHREASMLVLSPDPLLRGQYVALLGRITALLAIVDGQVPDSLETGAFGKEG
jgi:hypothetical protein